MSNTPNHAFCARCGLRKQLCRDRCAGKTQLELTVEGFKRDIWVWVLNTRTRIQICEQAEARKAASRSSPAAVLRVVR